MNIQRLEFWARGKVTYFKILTSVTHSFISVSEHMYTEKFGTTFWNWMDDLILNSFQTLKIIWYILWSCEKVAIFQGISLLLWYFVYSERLKLHKNDSYKWRMCVSAFFCSSIAFDSFLCCHGNILHFFVKYWICFYLFIFLQENWTKCHPHFASEKSVNSGFIVHVSVNRNLQIDMI